MPHSAPFPGVSPLTWTRDLSNCAYWLCCFKILVIMRSQRHKAQLFFTIVPHIIMLSLSFFSWHKWLSSLASFEFFAVFAIVAQICYLIIPNPDRWVFRSESSHVSPLAPWWTCSWCFWLTFWAIIEKIWDSCIAYYHWQDRFQPQILALLLLLLIVVMHLLISKNHFVFISSLSSYKDLML